MKIVPERDDVPTLVRPASSHSGTAGVVWLALALLLIGLGLLFYQNSQQSKLLQQQRNTLDQAAQRISILEDELTATGRTLSKSGNTLEKRIRDSEHEIRKLWDLSNKRNKVDIAANEKQLQQLDKSIKALTTEQKSWQNAFSDEQSIRENRDKALSAEQQVFASRLNSADTSLETLREQQKKLATELAALKKAVADVDSKALQNLNNTLSVHGERLDAIDASRRQLTSSVTRLTTDVNSLQLKVNALEEADQLR